MVEQIKQLAEIGQSLWYDNIQRNLLNNGAMEKMMLEGKIRGVTSNPSIFQKAISNSKDYDATLKPMAWSGLDADSIFWQLAIEDIQKTADLFSQLYERTGKKDGYVSLEVNPLLANNTDATITEARKLWKRVNRPNLMIKIPATPEGIPAIRKAIADGINVNVTLIFSLERYNAVIDAFLSGLEDRLAAGEEISSIASVASFFVSRLDTKIDGWLEGLGKTGDLVEATRIELSGKAAIVNAKLAYYLFEKRFSETRFKVLQDKGAQVQRPLWASTSTKNPNYRDVIYIEELIGKETVNTVPPATLEAFFDHGEAKETIHNGLPEARKFLIELEKTGISLDKATQELEIEGVKAFADAFTQLLEAVEQRRKAAVAELGSLARGVQDQVTKLQEMDFSSRLYSKDPTLWSHDPVEMAEIKDRMNWLTAPRDSQEFVSDLIAFANGCILRGYTQAVLLGMGGSSLAPEVLSLIYETESGKRRPGLKLAILDSTDPVQVAAVERTAPIEKTLYIVASKSGTTGEINAFLAYFWDLAFKLFGEKAGEHFIAITDPDTKLADLALTRKFLKIFTADPRVGGRNSALTAFGIVPAALIGMDVELLLSNASATVNLCLPDNPMVANPGLVLGAIIGYGTLAGKDKLTVITDTFWKPLGAWLEQLVAESSGKDGKGIVPVSDEYEMQSVEYGSDRLFVYIRQNGNRQQFTDELIKTDTPWSSLMFQVLTDLGGQFYLWEIATATACSVIGVNSFDQPDVQDAKSRTLEGLEEYRRNGKFSEWTPTMVVKNAKVMTRQQFSPVI